MGKGIYNMEAVVVRKNRRDNLHISWDESDGFVLLFTPDMENIWNHYHVELNEKQAIRLSSFLNRKLSELKTNDERSERIHSEPKKKR